MSIIETTQLKIEKLTARFEAGVKAHSAVMGERDLTQEAKMRKAGEVWQVASADISSTVSASVSHLRGLHSGFLGQAAAARSKAAESWNFARLAVEQSELKARFTGARSAGDLSESYKQVVASGDPHTRRAAAGAVAEVAGKFLWSGDTRAGMIGNAIIKQANRDLETVTTPPQVADAESRATEVAMAGQNLRGAAIRLAREVGSYSLAGKRLIEESAQGIKETFMIGKNETIVEFVEPEPAAERVFVREA